MSNSPSLEAQLFDLNQCDKQCHSCIKGYIKKHSLKKGDSFKVSCSGIPLEYIPSSILDTLDEDKELAISMYDPVTWAAQMLDWHCLDPKGEHWKRKTQENTLPPMAATYDPVLAKQGRSIFHRLYQASIMRCTSKYKVLRLGRQLGKTEVLCIIMLYSVFVNEGFRVVVVAPYQSQIDLIFSRVNNLIKSNPLLQNSVKRNVKAPNYAIELYNSSIMVGFTAGTRSGQEAGAARGQPAHMLVFDEADWLSPGDLQATLATILNAPKAQVLMSSTPTGKREKFYESCNSPDWKEYHYPSSVNPNWNEKLEEFFKSEYTEDQYNHEVMAVFGEQEEGVYQMKYIERAQADYEYGDYTYNPQWIYTIGVDWNSPAIGTTIAVVGFDPNGQVFCLVDKSIVQRDGWTQIAACQQIAAFNRKWHASSIYVDQGYGHVQVELLKHLGHRMTLQNGPHDPDAKLKNIVKGFDFGGSVEVRDLWTKEKIKKPAKPFLVENSVRRFENNQFKYPKSDTSYSAQLMGYIVDRISQSGRPVYKAQNEKAGDHFLDAVNLALLAFTLEQTEMGKPTYNNDIALAGKFGESVLEQYEREEKKTTETRVDDTLTTETVSHLNSDRVPASHYSGGPAKVYEWPGFHHDAPPPQRKRFAGRRLQIGPPRSKPQRSKF